MIKLNIKKYTLIAGIALLLVGLLSAATFAESADEPTENDFKSQALAIITPFLEQNAVPGSAIALHYKGEDYIFTNGYANEANQTPVTSETIFDLASITKVFTTTLLAVELTRGHIKLSDPIVNFLPALKDTTDLPVDQITVANLATHTASLPRDVTDLGIVKNNDSLLTDALKAWKPAYPIGTRYVYSNISFGLLGRVVETSANKSYLDQLNIDIFTPLNMTHTLITFPPSLQNDKATGYGPLGRPQPTFQSTYLYGGGALRSNITDMLAFLKAELGIDQAKHPYLTNAMMVSQRPIYRVNPKFVMGLGWQRMTRNGNLYITKNGGDIGFSTFIGFSPDNQFGVVVLINKSQVNAGGLGNKLLNLMQGS